MCSILGGRGGGWVVRFASCNKIPVCRGQHRIKRYAPSFTIFQIFSTETLKF